MGLNFPNCYPVEKNSDVLRRFYIVKNADFFTGFVMAFIEITFNGVSYMANENGKKLPQGLLRIIKNEVKKANNKIQTFNTFQKNLFAETGVTKNISYAGDIYEKLKAYNLAKQINDSGIASRTDYKNFNRQLQADLRLSEKEVEYMLENIDFANRDFMGQLRYGSNPQVDFLFDDAIRIFDSVDNDVNEVINYWQKINPIGDATDLFRG